MRMIVMRRRFPAFLILFSLFTAAPVFTQPADPREILLPVMELYLNGRYSRALQLLESGPDWPPQNDDIPLLAGMTELWKGRILLALGKENEAEQTLLRAAEKGAELESGPGKTPQDPSEAAEALVLQAEARAEIMLFKGTAYIIRNGGKVQDLAAGALDLNPEHPEAQIIFAQGRINAPRIFGGNREEGLAMLYRLWERRPGGTGKPVLTGPQAFRTAAALGAALEKKEPEQAAEFYRKALLLYPENPDIRTRLNQTD